jgi:chemotaxis protein MotB
MSRKAPEAPKAENHERWIVSYADMLTLLFALFVVLYAISDTNPRKVTALQKSLDRAFNVGVLTGDSGSSPIFDAGGGLAPSIAEIKGKDLAVIRMKVSALAQGRGLGNKIQVRQDADSITISLADNLLFDSGSAELKPGSGAVLTEIASVLASLPNQLRIEGHTDNVPVNSQIYPTNWELSGARATTVLRFMAESGGLAATRMQTAGFAETRPIAENTTPEGRALNRRADIVILYPTQAALEAALSAGKGR